MAEPRIIDIELDERSILRRNADIEQERRIAIFDLLEGNSFDAAGHDGPFRVLLRVEEGRLAIDLHDEAGAPLDTIRMGLARFRRPIRDYFAICESYFKAVRSDGAARHRGDRHGPARPPQRGAPSCCRNASTARSRWISTPRGACSP